MANLELPVNLALAEHRKVYQLADHLGLQGRAEAKGILLNLWQWALSQRVGPDGDVSGIPLGQWDRVFDCSRPAGEVIEALVACRWLDRDANGRLSIHDWAEHGAKVWARIDTATQRKARFRATLRAQREGNAKGTGTSRGQRRDSPGDVPGTKAGRPAQDYDYDYDHDYDQGSLSLPRDARARGSESVKADPAQDVLTEIQEALDQIPDPVSVKPDIALRNRRPPNGDDGFDAFFKAYPLRIGRGNAKEVWRLMTSDDRLDAVRGVVVYAEVVRRLPEKSERRRFIPDPERWLRERKWEDDPSSIATRLGADQPSIGGAPPVSSNIDAMIAQERARQGQPRNPK